MFLISEWCISNRCPTHPAWCGFLLNRNVVFPLCVFLSIIHVLKTLLRSQLHWIFYSRSILFAIGSVLSCHVYWFFSYHFGLKSQCLSFLKVLILSIVIRDNAFVLKPSWYRRSILIHFLYWVRGKVCTETQEKHHNDCCENFPPLDVFQKTTPDLLSHLGLFQLIKCLLLLFVLQLLIELLML